MNEEKEFDIHIWDAAAPDGDYAEAGLMKLLTIAEEKHHYPGGTDPEYYKKQ